MLMNEEMRTTMKRQESRRPKMQRVSTDDADADERRRVDDPKSRLLSADDDGDDAEPTSLLLLSPVLCERTLLVMNLMVAESNNRL